VKSLTEKSVKKLLMTKSKKEKEGVRITVNAYFFLY